jgi:hypothetical protein
MADIADKLSERLTFTEAAERYSEHWHKDWLIQYHLAKVRRYKGLEIDDCLGANWWRTWREMERDLRTRIEGGELRFAGLRDGDAHATWPDAEWIRHAHFDPFGGTASGNGIELQHVRLYPLSSASAEPPAPGNPSKGEKVRRQSRSWVRESKIRDWYVAEAKRARESKVKLVQADVIKRCQLSVRDGGTGCTRTQARNGYTKDLPEDVKNPRHRPPKLAE